MSAIKKILVAVKNPDARRQPGVDKAIGIASSLGASVELFNAISTPVFLELEPLTGQTVTEIRREALELRRARLRKSRRARKRGVKATGSVRVGLPAARSHRAPCAGSKARSHHRRMPPGPAAEALAHPPDRLGTAAHQPAAGTVAQERRPWREPTILAAVDPAHA